jgi:AcrR family transcriptional regulator
MMNMKSDRGHTQRGYTQTLRAQKALDSEARILDEAERLFSTELFDRVTLEAVARGAGVTIPTVQRRFGGKEGLFMACGERVRARVHAQRGAPPLHDVPAAIRQLVAHYEAEGRNVWHWLRQEADVPFLHAGLEEGRATHRAWVMAAFGLAREPLRAHVDALVAVTDLFTWKLLRLDLGRTRVEVERTMITMAQAIVQGAA